MPAQPRSPRGLLAVGLFLCFAATASSYAGVTLLFPGTTLDRAWALNPKAHQQLASLGHLIGVAFLLLAAIFVFDAVGWFRRRRWAWRLTVVIIALQVLGDAINVLAGDVLRGILGVLIASALLFYLIRPVVRYAFGS